MSRASLATALRARRSARGGFTMVEVVIASALLGFSLIVMFGFHSQAVRANMNARRLTDCTYLAQTQMERLMAVEWTSASRPAALLPGSGDASTTAMYGELEWPGTGVEVNNLYDTTASQLSPTLYTVSWDVENMDTNETWIRLRVRCTYEDETFGGAHGTTISSYRYRDS
ncbi:MAG: hypothetical protein ACK4YP_13405 [Myxococcota bacterium]